MKKSEMIDLIAEYLATDGVIQKTACTLDDIAYDILNLVLKERMEPPYVNGNTSSYYAAVTTGGNYWEPEDEK